MKVFCQSKETCESLGVVKKKIKVGSVSITTPNKGVKSKNSKDFHSNNLVNEIPKLIQKRTLKALHETDYAKKYERKTKKEFIEDSLNLTIPNLSTPNLPDEELTTVLAHTVYAISDRIVCSPTVKKNHLTSDALTRNGNPKKMFTKNSVNKYLDFQKKFIEEVKLKNSKCIAGTVPLNLPPKYMKQIIDLYYSFEINMFVLDANTSNVFNNESALRQFLSYVNQKEKEYGNCLLDTYIHGVNFGIDNFTADTVSADDFLNFFTYIDTIGTMSKSRFVPKSPLKQYPEEPKKKIFMPQKYSYDLVETLNAPKYDELKKVGSIERVKKYNEKNQCLEAKKLRDQVGEKELPNYISTKKGISETSMKKMNSLFEKLKI